MVANADLFAFVPRSGNAAKVDGVSIQNQPKGQVGHVPVSGKTSWKFCSTLHGKLEPRKSVDFAEGTRRSQVECMVLSDVNKQGTEEMVVKKKSRTLCDFASRNR